MSKSKTPKTSGESSTGIFIPCPVCMMAWAGAVSEPDCPVCEGEARLQLSESAVKAYGARTVSAALWLGLARAARKAMVDHPDDVEGHHRKAVLGACVGRAVAANLVGEAKPWGGEGRAWSFKNDSWTRREPDPVRLSRLLCDAPLHESDVVTLMAPHEPPGPACRPVARGGRPALSEHGHPSLLAVVADPYDMDLDNRKRIAEWAAKWREADVLDRAVTEMTRNATTRAWGGQQTELFDIVGDAA